MSLINDALKRARTAQPKTASPANGPLLHPVDAPRRAVAGNDFLLPTLIVVVLLLAALLLWSWFHASGDLKVRARSLLTAMQPALALTPVTHNPFNSALATNSDKPIAAAPATNPIVASTNPPGSAVNPPATGVVDATLAARALPVTYKLQGIFYRVGNPSAVINGKLVFQGSTVAGAKVLAISTDTVVLLTPDGRTNALGSP